MKPLQNKPKNRSFWSKLSTASLDFNGTDFNLEFPSNNGKFQSKFGGYLSLIISFTVILTFILSVSQLFSDNSPVVNITPEFNDGNVLINLYEEDVISPIMFKKGNKLISTPEELSRYFTVKFFAMDWYFDDAATRYKVESSTEYRLTTCSKVGGQHPRVTTLVDNLFENSKSLKKYLFCPDLGDKKELYKVKARQGSIDFSFIRARFYPCSLPDASNCATPAELDQIEVSFYSNYKVLDASDYEQPIKYTPKKHKLRMDRSSRKIFKYTLNDNFIVDDSTQIKSSQTGDKFAVLLLEKDNKSSRDASVTRCTAAQLAPGYFTRCSYYIEAEYRPRTNLFKIRRSYKKASVMLGEFGGYLKLLMSVVFLLYSAVTSKSMKKYLAKKILPGSDLSMNQEVFASTNGQKSSQLKNGKEVNRPSQKAVLHELVESRIDVNSFQKTMGFIEMLKSRFIAEDKAELINSSVFRKFANNDDNQDKGGQLENKKATIIKKMNKAVPGTSLGPHELSEAYMKVKEASLLPSSDVKKLINFYFLDTLKGDFEAQPTC